MDSVTDAMVAVEGEALRGVTWVRIQEFRQGDWAIGGNRMRAHDVHALMNPTQFTPHAAAPPLGL